VKTLNKLAILIGTLTMATQLSAATKPLAKEDGFGAQMSLDTGVLYRESQFNTDDENERTDDLNDSGTSTTNAVLYPLARFQYTFNNQNSQVFIGNSEDEIVSANFQYELGFIQNFESVGEFTVAVSPQLTLMNETWEDPFLEGEDRKDTKEKVISARFQLKEVFGSPFTLKYGYASSKVDDEKSGSDTTKYTDKDRDLLKRDSKFHRVEVEMFYPISETLQLRPNLKYTLSNADGDANSYDSLGAELSVLSFQGRHSYILTIRASMKKFDEKNPIFDEKQDSVDLGVIGIYAYEKPFGWEKSNFHMLTGFYSENSDIDFYSNKNAVLTFGFGTNF